MSDAEMRTMLANLMRDQSDGQREARDAVINGGSTYHSTGEVVRAMLAAEAAAIDRAAGYVEGAGGVIPGATVFAPLVSGNNMPCMSGDARDRLHPNKRRYFDDATKTLATALRTLKEGASHVG